MVVGVQVADVVSKKLVLHASKYPSNDVLGIVTGTKDGSGFKVKNCYPLTHSRATGITTQFAFDVISKIKAADESIIGVYESSIWGESHSDSAVQLSAALRDYFEIPQSVLLSMEYETLGDKEMPEKPLIGVIMEKDEKLQAKLSIQPYILSQSEKAKAEPVAIPLSLLEGLIVSVTYRPNPQENLVRFYDIDNHLENPALDIRNKFVN